MTVEGFRADFDGRTSSAGACNGALPATTSCRSEDSSKFSSIGAMVNGYVDLGTFSGFTPYVGAGLGYSLVRWQGLDNTLYCVGADCPSAAPVSTTQHGGEKDWRFTYALMAGVAYWLLQNCIIATQGENSILKKAIGADWKGKSSPVFYMIGIVLSFVDPWLGGARLERGVPPPAGERPAGPAADESHRVLSDAGR